MILAENAPLPLGQRFDSSSSLTRTAMCDDSVFSERNGTKSRARAKRPNKNAAMDDADVGDLEALERESS